MKKNISIHDIARQLKVSATAVSFVLNGKAEEKRISSVLEKRIKDYIREIGYHPNHVAQSLRTGKSKIIGMLVEDISDPFFSGVARIIEENLYSLGYKIFHSSTNNNTLRTKALLRIFRERQVDGYIIVPSPGIENDIQHLLSQSKPVVLFDRYFTGIDTHNIVVNNYGGAYTATSHFIQNGYKNIALVTLASRQMQMISRHEGYLEALKKNWLYPNVLSVPYDLETDAVAPNVKAFVEKNRQVDAILFATNYLAIAGLLALKELGRQIPEDIAIIGFDDNTHFSLFSPSVTAVAQPVKKIANAIAETITQVLISKEQRKESNTRVLPVQLIVRESSAPRSHKNRDY